MKLDNIQELLQKYYEGETNLAEEKILKDFFSQTKLLPDNLKPHAAQFTFYSNQEAEKVDKFLADDWLFQKIEQAPAKVTKGAAFKLNAYWRVAASIALLITAFWAGNYYRQNFTGIGRNEVAILRQEVQEMQKILASATNPTDASASERIQAVSQEFKPGKADKIILLLEKTMNTDPNVNVRLAACEALYKLTDEAAARQALVQSLAIQTNPLMQITLIDMVVALQDKKAAEHLKLLAGKPGVLPVVKDKAQQGLGKLI